MILNFKMNRNVFKNDFTYYISVSTFKVVEININGQKMGFLVIFEQLQKISLSNFIFDLYQVYKIRQDLFGSIVLVKLGTE